MSLAFLLLSRADRGGRRRIMREALIYRRLEPATRMEYKAPGMINKNKRRLFALAFLMVAIDTPVLIGLFFVISLVFMCLMLARVLVYLFK